jgi:hypothetical protein
MNKDIAKQTKGEVIKMYEWSKYPTIGLRTLH